MNVTKSCSTPGQAEFAVRSLRQDGADHPPPEPTVFGVLRQTLARLQSAGETLETLGNRVQLWPSKGVCGAENHVKEPTLLDMAEKCAALASAIGDEVNDLAKKIGQ